LRRRPCQLRWSALTEAAAHVPILNIAAFWFYAFTLRRS
jgi:hypothetical protein